MRILVAEPNPLLLERIVSVLDHQDHSVTSRTSGDRVLRTLSERSFDLVILADRLPEVSAREILTQMPQQNQGVAVLILYNGEQTTDWPRSVHVLLKPFSTARLLAAVQAVSAARAQPLRSHRVIRDPSRWARHVSQF